LAAIAGLALFAAQARTIDLGLVRRHDIVGSGDRVGVGEEVLAAIVADVPVLPYRISAAAEHDQNPHRVPIVERLLRMAGKARRRSGSAIVVRLEDRIDELNEQLVATAQQMESRIQDAKLAALAELAAGAGHEINNPLAVISGNAQRLLKADLAGDCAESIRTILRQTQRVATILRDLMQFARPTRPVIKPVGGAEILAAVHNALHDVARERGVRLEIPESPPGCRLRADAKQIRQALSALVRNGIEAAGTGGWTRVSVSIRGDAIAFSVEDSGSGLTADAAAHAFDPFYCNRSAGRGRGLGLPTAWQLARQNGGEVRFVPRTSGPTLFTLTIPSADDHSSWLDRKSA
jgi:signal transduction histidine kinase